MEWTAASVVAGDEAGRRLPTVDRTTPKTMATKLPTSGAVRTSIPHQTATDADVMGSDALMVSTKLASAPEKPRLVSRNPNPKKRAAQASDG
jgi:hypothetical protein